MIKHNDNYNRPSSKMPAGYNYITNSVEDGYVDLKYIDFYDYLPKEYIEKFNKEFFYYVSKYGLSMFNSSSANSINERFKNMERLYDYDSFNILGAIDLKRNKLLSPFIHQLSIKVFNLSSSFLAIQYRFYLKDDFNKCLHSIYTTDYNSYTEPFRLMGVPWYKPYRFGKSYFDGNNKREEEFYKRVSSLKWTLFNELRRSFTIYFENNDMFPPTFCTYLTNIRPSNDYQNKEFWRIIQFELHADYSVNYNSCICFRNDRPIEGRCFSAYCGGGYSEEDFEKEIIVHEISDNYGVYMVAGCINYIAKRDIIYLNRKMSKAISSARLRYILKERIKANKKLYYSYRFVSEFSGKSIGGSYANDFVSIYTRKKSYTKDCFSGIVNSTEDTKSQIDKLLNHLNASAEYGSVKSNFTIQWIMLLITLLSLIIASFSLFNDELLDLLNSIVGFWFDIC